MVGGHVSRVYASIDVLNRVIRFLLVLIPSGPSAMLLANVAELVNLDQGPIAGYLTISVSTHLGLKSSNCLYTPSPVYLLSADGSSMLSWFARGGHGG